MRLIFAICLAIGVLLAGSRVFGSEATPAYIAVVELLESGGEKVISFYNEDGEVPLDKDIARIKRRVAPGRRLLDLSGRKSGSYIYMGFSPQGRFNSRIFSVHQLDRKLQLDVDGKVFSVKELIELYGFIRAPLKPH